MVKFYDSISDDLRDWALEQPVFFTASAPLAGRHVNLSPKGLPSTTFSIFDPNHAAYIDATGSGVETISHLYENGRITIMFCSFSTTPRILRFFCTGSVVEWDEPGFEPLIKRMGKKRVVGARAVILLDVFKVQTSCGYGVPFLAAGPSSSEDRPSSSPSIELAPASASAPAPASAPASAPAPAPALAPASSPAPAPALASAAPTPLLKDRDTLGHWASTQVAKDKLQTYQAAMNASSLDGLTGLRAARRQAGERWLWLTEGRAHARRIMAQGEAVGVGMIIGVLLAVVAAWVKRAIGQLYLMSRT